MNHKRDYRIIAGRYAIVAIPIVGTSGIDYVIGDWLFWLLLLCGLALGVWLWWMIGGSPKAGRK